MLLAGALKQYLKQTIKQNHYKHLLLPSNWQTQTVKTMPKKGNLLHYRVTVSPSVHVCFMWFSSSILYEWKKSFLSGTVSYMDAQLMHNICSPISKSCCVSNLPIRSAQTSSIHYNFTFYNIALQRKWHSTENQKKIYGLNQGFLLLYTHSGISTTPVPIPTPLF